MAPPSSFKDMLRGNLAAVGLSLVIAVAACGFAVQTRLWDRDEARYARATVEMFESGNYLVPSFNGAPRLHKPPMIYWLMSLPVRFSGPAEWAFRFFSCIALGGTCWLTYGIGRRLLSARAGLWSMGVLASSVMMIFVGTAATTDSVLVFLSTAQMALFLRILLEGCRIRDVLMLGFAMAGGMLVKGPAGLVPAAIMAGIMALDVRARRSIIGVGCALAIGVACFLAWAIPANRATGGAFFTVGIGFHVVERALRPLEGHGGGVLAFLFYYPVTVLVGFLPWSGLLPAGISALRAGRMGGDVFRRTVVCWIGIPMVLMACAQTKLPHYIAPIMPALALLAGALIAHGHESGLEMRGARWRRAGMWAALALALAAGLTLLIAPRWLGVPGLALPSGIAGAVVLLGSAALVRFRDSQIDRLALGTMACMGLFIVPVAFGILPALDAIRFGPPLGMAVRALAKEGVSVASIGQQEPSVYFYAGRRIEALESAAAVKRWVTDHPGGLLITTREMKDIGERVAGPLPADVISSQRGFNYVNGKWVEGLILRVRSAQ